MTLDDDLRAAFGSGDGGADGDFADVTQRAAGIRRRRTIARTGLGAAAVALAITGGLAFTGADDEQGVVATDPDPATTTTSSSTTITTSSTSTTAATSAPSLPEGPPRQIVALDGNEDLVVLDTATGAVLLRCASCIDADFAVGPWTTADDVFVTLGRPFDSQVLRFRRSDLGDPTVIADGVTLGVSPDEERLAILDSDDEGLEHTITLTSTDGSGGYVLARDPDGGDLHRSDSWSPDGRSLALGVLRHDDAMFGVQVVDVDAGAAGPVWIPSGRDRSWMNPTFRSDGLLVVQEVTYCQVLGDETMDPACVEEPTQGRLIDPSTGEVVDDFDYGTDERIIGQQHDATGTWLLATFADGSIRWYGDGRSGVIPGDFQGADW